MVNIFTKHLLCTEHCCMSFHELAHNNPVDRYYYYLHIRDKDVEGQRDK